MRRISLMVAVLLMFLTVSSIQAAPVQISYKEMPPDPSQPLVTLCIAYSANGQSCKKCHENFYPDGRSMGMVCRSVFANSSCSCKFENGGCTSQGECFYR
jgi:hypothetical protein